MKDLKDLLIESQENNVNERRIWKSLDECLVEHVTQAFKDAWDESGIEFTHKEVKEALEKLAKTYDIDKEIDWAADIIK